LGTCQPWFAARGGKRRFLRRNWLMNDLRNRALRAAQEKAGQNQREADARAEQQRQWEAQVVAAAEAACEKELGVKAKFSMYTVLAADGVETAERAACTEVEGVRVTFRKYWLGSNAGDGQQYEWRLSPGLVGLGEAIQARENAARAKTEHEARLAPVRLARTCNWCGEVVTIRWDGHTVRDDFPTARANAEAVAEHKKRYCRKVPWWRRIGHEGWGTG
jgi:hypothetical protein